MNLTNGYRYGLSLGIVVVFAAGMAALGQAVGGGFQFIGQSIGGGGTSQGGAFILRGGVSQSAAGRSVSVVDPGGTPPIYQVFGGWLGPTSGVATGRPSIRVRFTEDKLAELTWDLDITGYVLEFSSAIGPAADWQPVSPQPSGPSFTTPCQQPARYFRLRRL